jgi:hypothetical protein
VTRSSPLWLALAVPALAAFILYLPTLATGFVADDFGLLHAFDGARNVSELAARVAEMFVSGVGPPSNQYRPLTMLSFAVNTVLGADPRGWHLVNILLHAANSALVALLALQLAHDRARDARYAALAAGWLFAWFAPGVEAVAWVAARFDGMALFWILVAGCAFLRSRERRDRFAVVSLAATVLAFMSKESGAIAPVLIAALAWWMRPEDEPPLRAVLRAAGTAAPWLLLAAAYFAFRTWIFGDPFRFFPGTSPLRSLLSGEWLILLPSIVDWSRAALPETGPRQAFGGAGLMLLACAVVAAFRERAQARALLAVALAVLAAFALLLPHWKWAANGEGGRVLYSIGAISILGLTLPLSAAGHRLRAVAWIFAGVMLTSEFLLAHAAVLRWARAGDDARTLAAALARTAEATPADGFAFIVIPDHVDAIPFGRNAQGGLMLPPVQAQSLSPKLVVQTPEELARWPDLFERDIIGRLRREPLGSVAANPLTPKVPPPHMLPDRYFCWSPRAAALVPLPLIRDVALGDWDAAWSRGLDAAGCRG